MSEWTTRRFWTEASVEPVGSGHAVRLDGRAVRTPLKTELVVPSAALAHGVAEEWRAQEKMVDPRTMPLTRAVNATLDKVVPQRAEVAANLVEYGVTDLLCYRAPVDGTLFERQDREWQPMLDWAEERFGARLAVTRGVIPVPQPPEAVLPLRARVESMSEWELTALSEFVSLSGSLVLGLAAMEDHPPEAIWTLSRIDEDWQAEQWGVDEEEAERIALKRAAFLQAHRYLGLVRAG